MQQHEMLDYIWVLTAGILVFMMQAGFMCLEVGLVRQKNSINVAIKNVTDFLISSISFFAVGFALMFGTSFHGLIGTDGWFLNKYIQLDTQGWIYTFWFFQVVFCGAAATIVSGGVAERMHFKGYMIISLIISTFIYPVFGHWVWGGAYAFAPTQGWLAALGYKDFAGSSVVHMVGGVTTLACLFVLGPRRGRYNPNGSINKIWGSDIPMSTLGLFLLWMGWFGFNGGSTLGATKDIGLIIMNTNLAACSGGLSCFYFAWRQRKNFDVTAIINGCLGGLVAITASCAFVTPVSALIIGILAGPVLLVAEKLLDKFHLDDAVGAVPVHGACGILGILCVGFFAEPQHLIHGNRFEQIAIQALGAGTCFFFTFTVTWILMKSINHYMKLRVSPEAEDKGLNVSEHEARTLWYDLAEDIHQIEKKSDLSKRAVVEPETETGVVASMFNKLMDSLEQKVKELEETRLQLLQSEKMASIGQLAAGVAHEINNPVGFISSNMEILQEYIQNYTKILQIMQNLKQKVREGDIEKVKLAVEALNKFEQEINLDFIMDDVHKLLEHSSRGLERIKKIVMDLRTFAREDNVEAMESVRVEEVIDSILSIVQSELKYKAELIKEYGETPLLKCSPQRLGQVFINLLINASQAMEGKGKITIKTYRDNGFVCVDIKDTGKGIEEKNLKKIFDPFFTTKPVGQGTGLGLSVSYEIMKKHGGEIKIKSKVGEGTTFTVMLPV